MDENQESIPVFGQPHKRIRRGSIGPSGGAGYSSKRGTDMANATDQADRPDTLTEVTDLNLHDSLMGELDSDPYEANPEVVTHYIDKYFANVNGGIYNMFPRKPFLLWLKSCRKKSFDDKMLIYSMLAMGTIFSSSRASDCREKILKDGQAGGRNKAELLDFATRSESDNFEPVVLCYRRFGKSLGFHWGSCEDSVRTSL